VAGGWRRLHSEELHNLYASTHVTKVTNSMTRWMRNTAHMHRKILPENLKGRNHLEDLGIDEKIILG
jgi:hypothetical protein